MRINGKSVLAIVWMGCLCLSASCQAFNPRLPGKTSLPVGSNLSADPVSTPVMTVAPSPLPNQRNASISGTPGDLATAVPAVSPTPVADETGPQKANSRGYLTTPEELAVIAQKAQQGKEPYKSAVAGVLSWASKPWDYTLDAEVLCPDSNHPAWLDDQEGVPKLYARALSYHLTGDPRYAAEARAILERIMTEVKSISLEDQQCRLNFSWGTPELVASADLLEAYWANMTCTGPVDTTYGDNQIAEGNCKRLFQNWLVKNPYYVTSYAAERSQSNWGAAATNTMAYIADYLWDRNEVKLISRLKPLPSGYQEISLSPAQAYARAGKLALDRMNGYRVDLDSNQSCDYLSGIQQSPDFPPVKSQITERGIIPEDARRKEFCNIPVYDGQYENYPQVHIGNNIQQCELMLRRGDRSCYDNVSQEDMPNFTFTDAADVTHTVTLLKGRGSIERAIDAIIIDAKTEWRKTSALEVAYRYYYRHHTLPGFDQWFAQLKRPSDCSQDICFGMLTHGFAPDETPSDPPTVHPPE